MPTAMVEEARCRIGQEKKGGGASLIWGAKRMSDILGGGGAKAYHGGLGGLGVGGDGP